MLLIYKNKGLLVLLYIIVSLLVCAEVTGILHRNTTGIFSQIDFYTTMGAAFLIAAAWTYLTKDNYYKDKDGIKKKMDSVNEFFFLRMEIWAYILVVGALVFLGNLLFHYFEPVE